MTPEETFIDLRLNYYEARMVRAALRQQRRKHERQITNRPDFKPEPGKLDLNKSRVAMLAAVEIDIDTRLSAAIEEAKQ